MNIPISILKSNYLPQERVKYQQKIAKKYYKHISKIKNSYSSKKPKIDNNINQNSLKEEIINWFFSFDLLTKLIISSIENVWLTNILHQLYLQQKTNHQVRFQYRGEETLSEIIPQFLPQNMTIINNSHENLCCFVNYFYCKDESRMNKEKLIMEKFFWPELKFYKTEDSRISANNLSSNNFSHYFSLSSKMCSDENLFRKIFETFSNGQAFTNIIPCEKDSKSKTYSFGLPSWINNKEYYSVAEFFVAFFEQIITVKFFLDKQESKTYTHKKTFYSKNENIYLAKLLNEKKDLMEFFSRDFKNDKIKLCEALKCRSLIEEVQSDFRVKEVIKCKNKQEYFPIIYSMIFDNDYLSSFDLESNLKSYFLSLNNEEEFIDSLIFSTIENIFTYDDFLLKRIYEALIDLYAHKNALDLMNDEEEKIDIKKKKKKRNNKKYEENETEIEKPNDNTIVDDIELGLKKSSFSFIKKSNIKETQSDFVMKEFMGSIMLTKINVDVKELVKEIIEKACERINLKNQLTIQSIDKQDNFDIDTAYSSANLSDNSKKDSSSDNKKKKKKNNYFLYDIKLKDKKKKGSLQIEVKDNKEVKRERIQSTNIAPSNILEKSIPDTKVSTPVKNNNSDSVPLKSNYNQPYFYNNIYKNNFYCYYNYFDVPNYYYYNNDLFYYKFNKYIDNYSKTIEKNLINLRDTKMSVVTSLEKLIKNSMNNNVSIDIYGSFSNGLAIESSDIDIMINCSTDEITINMSKITDTLKSIKKIESIIPIYTASVPVIKLEIDPAVFLDESEGMKFKKIIQSLNNPDELKKIKIDLTFGNNDVILKQVEYVKNCINLYPEIIPITRVLKKLFRNRNLNLSFNGGISSYSLFLLILAYVKIHRLNNNFINLAKLLFDLLLYYGNYYDFFSSIIDVSLDYPYIVYNETLENVPVIFDPITHRNVAKSSYRINDIKLTFFNYYHKFNEIRVLVETKKLNDSEIILYEFLNGVN